MCRLALRLTGLSCILIANSGQADSPLEPKTDSRTTAAVEARPQAVATVGVEKLNVYDQPDEISYINDTLGVGDQVKVRGSVDGGWLAIDPPSSTICWIERTALDRSITHSGPVGPPPVLTRSRGAFSKERAWVTASRAVVRSGNPRAHAGAAQGLRRSGNHGTFR